jgi:hypothetical protein
LAFSKHVFLSPWTLSRVIGGERGFKWYRFCWSFFSNLVSPSLFSMDQRHITMRSGPPLLRVGDNFYSHINLGSSVARSMWYLWLSLRKKSPLHGIVLKIRGACDEKRIFIFFNFLNNEYRYGVRVYNWYTSKSLVCMGKHLQR